MEIFKKKKLLCFLFLFFAFIPFINVKAIDYGDGQHVYINIRTGDCVEASCNYNLVGTWLEFTHKDLSNYNWFTAFHNASNGGTYRIALVPKSLTEIDFNGSFSLPKSSSNLIYEYTVNSNTIVYKGNGSQSYGITAKDKTEVFTTIALKNITWSNETYNIIPGDNFMQDKTELEEKKQFSYNNDEMTNPMRYIDLYFDKEDFGKEINFELKIEDLFNYSSCSYCEYLDIDKFEFLYLIKDENGLYKWVDYSSLDTGLYFDYTDETFPRNEDGTGLILNGKINLNFDTSIYNFERIRASIKLNNGYNFKYTYSDDSNISAENIDEYYHYMTYNNGERLNRIEGGSTKYTILSTTKDNLNGALVVQYINTDKWLYAEYFDTFNHTYLENSNLFQEHYLFGGKDLAISKFTIGKNSNRGIYLMNYLYQKDDKNLNSKYYFYIPTDVSYSTTDYLDEGLYYDNDGNFNSSITPNPNYETDNLKFIDNFRGIFNFLNDLQTTSDTFNYMWNSFYNNMPSLVQNFFKFATHILCILIFMKIVGYE